MHGGVVQRVQYSVLVIFHGSAALAPKHEAIIVLAIKLSSYCQLYVECERTMEHQQYDSVVSALFHYISLFTVTLQYYYQSFKSFHPKDQAGPRYRWMCSPHGFQMSLSREGGVNAV